MDNIREQILKLLQETKAKQQTAVNDNIYYGGAIDACSVILNMIDQETQPKQEAIEAEVVNPS